MVGATTSQNVATLQQEQVVKVLTLSEFISIIQYYAYHIP